jgi:hypothetical protein
MVQAETVYNLQIQVTADYFIHDILSYKSSIRQTPLDLRKLSATDMNDRCDSVRWGSKLSAKPACDSFLHEFLAYSAHLKGQKCKSIRGALPSQRHAFDSTSALSDALIWNIIESCRRI